MEWSTGAEGMILITYPERESRRRHMLCVLSRMITWLIVLFVCRMLSRGDLINIHLYIHERQRLARNATLCPGGTWDQNPRSTSFFCFPLVLDQYQQILTSFRAKPSLNKIKQ